MNEELKKIMPDFLAFELALLTLFTLGFPFMSVSTTGLWPVTAQIGGYQTIDMWQAGFLSALISLFQLLFLINNIALLVIGLIGIIDLSKGVKIEIPLVKFDIGKIKIKNLREVLLFAYLILALLVFLFSFLIYIFGANNLNYKIGIGQILILLMGFGVNAWVILPMILKNKKKRVSSKSSEKELKGLDNEEVEKSD